MTVTFTTERRYQHSPGAEIEPIAPSLILARGDDGSIAVSTTTEAGVFITNTVLAPADVEDLAGWLIDLLGEDAHGVELIELVGNTTDDPIIVLDPDQVAALEQVASTSSFRPYVRVHLKGGGTLSVRGDVAGVRAILSA